MCAKFKIGSKSDLIELENIFTLENFKDLDHDSLVDACIISGCDYMDHLPGIGLKTAINLIRKHKTIDKIIEHLKEKSEFKEFDFKTYLENFQQT